MPGTTMPDYQHIILDKDRAGHIARLTINRPQRRNALHAAATDEMGQTIDDVAAAETTTLTSHDHGESTQAIRESRKPFYEGR